MGVRDEFVPSQIIAEPRASRLVGRPWLGVRFSCTGAYLRVYRNRDGSAYEARCPVCGAQVRFRVGTGGTSDRFFEVRCG